MNISVDIRQLRDLANKLEKAGPKLNKEVSREVEATAQDTLRQAKLFTPVDKGSLRSANSIEKIDDLTFKILNNKDYAPFVEFGTGKNAEIPSELADFAAKFKGSTSESWDNGLAEIEKWCIRKGIPKEAAFPIFISILKNGVHPQPFLYPAFKEGRKLLIKRMERHIKDFGIT